MSLLALTTGIHKSLLKKNPHRVHTNSTSTEVIITSEVWQHANKHIFFKQGHSVKGKDQELQGFTVSMSG